MKLRRPKVLEAKRISIEKDKTIETNTYIITFNTWKLIIGCTVGNVDSYIHTQLVPMSDLGTTEHSVQEIQQTNRVERIALTTWNLHVEE